MALPNISERFQKEHGSPGFYSSVEVRAESLRRIERNEVSDEFHYYGMGTELCLDLQKEPRLTAMGIYEAQPLDLRAYSAMAERYGKAFAQLKGVRNVALDVRGDLIASKVPPGSRGTLVEARAMLRAPHRLLCPEQP